MANILVLGSTGMLGSIVDLYFRTRTEHIVYSTRRDTSFKSENIFTLDVTCNIGELDTILNRNGIDYIINCVGVIKPYCKDDDHSGKIKAIEVNALFPYTLAKIAEENGAKVIQIATDCVFSGTIGNYVESSAHDPLDVYGKTKSLGEVYRGDFLNLSCSIIGPERKGKLSLLEWVLGQSDGTEVNGFAHHKWNGVTTLQFGQICQEIIVNDLFTNLVRRSNLWHVLPNETVDKYELVSLIAKVYDKDLIVNRMDDIGDPVHRTLASEREDWKYSQPTIKLSDALIELKDFSTKEGYYDI